MPDIVARPRVFQARLLKGGASEQDTGEKCGPRCATWRPNSALGDLDAARAAALALGYAAKASFIQRDTFFVVARGKLKLREQPPEAWLIHYERDRESGLMLSRYDIVPVADSTRTREMLARALGVLAEVRKHRTLLARRNVRFHLDRVETLGGFGEIEAVLAREARAIRATVRVPRARWSTNCSARSASPQMSLSRCRISK